VPDRASCIDELDACFVACEEAYVRLREGGVAARGSALGNGLLLAAATSMLASEALATADAGAREAVLLRLTGEACRACAEDCARDGAHWLAPVRDACVTAAAACEALARGRVANGD
jgi:hypothetical protein